MSCEGGGFLYVPAINGKASGCGQDRCRHGEDARAPSRAASIPQVVLYPFRRTSSWGGNRSIQSHRSVRSHQSGASLAPPELHPAASPRQSLRTRVSCSPPQVPRFPDNRGGQNFEGAGSGPIVTFNGKAGSVPVSLKLKYMHEFAAKRRFENNVLPLNPGPSF